MRRRGTRLDAEMWKHVEQASRRLHLSKSDFMRLALSEYLVGGRVELYAGAGTHKKEKEKR